MRRLDLRLSVRNRNSEIFDLRIGKVKSTFNTRDEEFGSAPACERPRMSLDDRSGRIVACARQNFGGIICVGAAVPGEQCGGDVALGASQARG